MARATWIALGVIAPAVLAGAYGFKRFHHVTPPPPSPPPAVHVPPPAPSAPVADGPPLRIPLGRATILLRHGCAGVHSTSDVLIHFHGASITVEPILLESGIDAIYVVATLGNASGPYEDTFAVRGSFSRYLASIQATVAAQCAGAPRALGRVALSAWSAGYGAVFRIIARAEDADRVDAVLLADGMHSRFDAGAYRHVNAPAMAPYTNFAERAARGEKLMVVTHTAIGTPNYASTTETAHFLMATLHIPRQELDEAGPAPEMRHTEHAERGGLSIDGYSGADAEAHKLQLKHIGETMWPRLRAAWDSGRR